MLKLTVWNCSKQSQETCVQFLPLPDIPEAGGKDEDFVDLLQILTHVCFSDMCSTFVITTI